MQVELRIMTFLAREERMWALLADTGQDPFRQLASLWLGTPLSQVCQASYTKLAVWAPLLSAAGFMRRNALAHAWQVVMSPFVSFPVACVSSAETQPSSVEHCEHARKCRRRPALVNCCSVHAVRL